MKTVILFLFLSLGLHVSCPAQTPNYEQIIFKELLRNQVDSSMAKIIVAIARHESGSFKSSLFLKYKNAFGMNYNAKRPYLAVGFIMMSDHGNKRKFSIYRTTTSATTSLVMYLKDKEYPLNIQTPEEMVKLMKKKKYFEAQEIVYLRSVKKHLSELKL